MPLRRPANRCPSLGLALHPPLVLWEVQGVMHLCIMAVMCHRL
jgi:hypothetical protein